MRSVFFRKKQAIVHKSPWDILDPLSQEGTIAFRFNKDQVYIFRGNDQIGQGKSFTKAVASIDSSHKHFSP